MTPKIYLDYNATAPLRPEALEGMTSLLARPLNASAVHGFGAEGRRLVESARAEIAALTGAPEAQVIFNSGATEGNNTVLHHFKGERVLVSAIEHPAVLDALDSTEHIPVTKSGMLDLNALETLLKTEPRAALVSVMAVNNETGVIQPIKEIGALAKRYGALVHCDAVQAAGRIKIDITALGVDFLTLSAHKLGGPQGVGALVLGLCGITPTLLHGGGQEKKARAGTENVAGIHGFGLAAKAARAQMESYQTLAELRDRIEDTLKKSAPEVVIHGQDAPRVSNTSLFSLPGAASSTMLMAFDLEGIALSNGAACSSGTVQASHVLKAMGVPDDQAGSALRVSMGWKTSEEDVEGFLAAWEKIVQRMR